ncbi:MAG: acyltransferase [Lachnospiraceae bacterium]|nr:acyltransferase [Lachnospiraceae bacterium]
MEKLNNVNDDHIYALDGLRTFGILLVSWFHLWQLSWLTPYTPVKNKILNSIGLYDLNLHTLVRFGYTSVEFLILLSAVVNFIPYAKAIVYETAFPDTKEFYIKRAIRILPSYYLCIIIMLIIALVNGSYTSIGFMLKDLISHLTFTGIFFTDVYTTSNLNGVLWTLQLEVLYYVLMPFIAKAFRKIPVITTTVILGISFLTCNIMTNTLKDALPYNNFFTTFAGYYVCGLLIAVIYFYAKKHNFINKYVKMGAILGIIFSVSVYGKILTSLYDQDRFHAQLALRHPLLMTIGLMTICLMFSPRPIQKVLGNKVIQFINIISYNLFIWHQQVFRFLREFRIPYWEGTEYPNKTGNRPWQIKYTVYCVIFSILFAALITFAFELPVGKFLRKRFLDKKKNSN